MSEAPSSGPDTITVHELLRRTATAALEHQRKDGSFPPGHNTVYEDPETPVRSTAAWLEVLCKAYELTGDDVFFEAGNNAADYLMSDDLRPHGYTYISRDSSQRDKCNGLIGQAYPIRALSRCGEVLGREELITLAEEVFRIHPFDDKLGLWERVEIDGERLSFDRTLNHQAMFAAGASYLADHSDKAKMKIEQFLSILNDNISLHDDGLIKHYVHPPFSRTVGRAVSTPRHWILLRNEVAVHYYSFSDERRQKEIGYQGMNLRAWSHLKRNYPDHPIWNTSEVTAAISYVGSEAFKSKFRGENSPFGGMSPGIGISRLYHYFNLNQQWAREWLSFDIYCKYDFKKDLYVLNTPDPLFQAALISELTDLPNWELRRRTDPPSSEVMQK